MARHQNMKSQIADEITTLITDFREKYAETLVKLPRHAERLQDASQQVSRSWSGSFAGWHGRMYFRDFKIPSIYQRFSGEWGAINGLPDGWEEKQPEEVRAQIDHIIGDDFSADNFDHLVEALQKDLIKLKERIVACLDGLESGDLPQRGKELVTQIEQFKTGKTKGEFIHEGLPGTMMSRDTEALRQGTCIASWLYYEGVALSARSLSDATIGLIDAGERLIKMLRSTPSTVKSPNASGLQTDLHPDIYAKCHDLYDKKAFAEAVEKSFKVVRDRLRTLTGYETGSEAFGKSKLHIRGAAASNVDDDFNHGVKFLTMAIDRFRNEKSHTSDAKIDDPIRAYEYLRLSSLAMNLLDNAEILP